MMNRLIRRWTVALAAVISLCAYGVANAELNPNPMAVPAIGTSGPASLYPSSIELKSPHGPNFKTHVQVHLIGVTHPCPRELALLLVHNGTDAYPLMYNAGGCRPMEGSTLMLDSREQMLPENPLPDAPPYSALFSAGHSRYGTMPTFPAPAPQSAKVHATMPDLVTLDGTWSLYVMDTGGNGRGIITGWQITYTTLMLYEQGRAIEVPGSTADGRARQYPIEFDLSDVNPDLRVVPENLGVTFTLEHERPRDLQIVLESPTQQRVVLMANAGGLTGIKRPIVFVGYDNTPKVPYDTPITEQVYRPGSAYDRVVLAPPAPDQPYQLSFNAFRGIPLKGIWKLWVYDSNPQTYHGRIDRPSLFYSALGDTYSRVTASANTPLTGTATQPFVRVEAHTERVVFPGWSPGLVMWYVRTDGKFYAAGTFDFKPGTTDIVADVPVQKGENVIDLIPFNGFVEPLGGTQIKRTVKEFTYALAEGATGGFFDLDITLANPGGAAAPIAMDFLPEGGTPIMTTNTVAANSPLQIHADQVTDRGATSTVVRSLDAVPLAIERTMSWNTSGYGGHGGGAVSPATRWLFAEGAQGFLKTYILLANDNAKDVPVTVKFLLEGGGVVTHVVTVPARSRETIDAGSLPDVIDRSFGLDISAETPIIAERAMYFSMGTNRPFDGGHESAGVNETNTRWFLAEGATGQFFDCFVLLSNPNNARARVKLTYLLSDGATYVQDVTMEPNSRHTINVETVAPMLANAEVSTTVTSDIGIVAERAMYWPNVSEGWREAHNSFGVTHTGLRWGLADGRLGGPRSYATFILLANPNPYEAEVRVRFLQAGREATTRTYRLPRTSRLTIQAGDIQELADGVFGAEIEVLNFQPIAVEKALYWNAEGQIWAAGTNVTATRLPPAGFTVVRIPR
jgi:subtilisin-like proprotein convertase family protein